MLSDGKAPHARRYTLRLVGFMSVYAALIVADGIWFRSATPPQGALRYAAAIAPAVPVIGVIWAMGAFMVELPDEYQRLRLATALLRATGLTLGVCTAWGFLQNYAEVPTPPLYGVFILFMGAFGVLQGVSSLMDRR